MLEELFHEKNLAQCYSAAGHNSNELGTGLYTNTGATYVLQCEQKHKHGKNRHILYGKGITCMDDLVTEFT